MNARSGAGIGVAGWPCTAADLDEAAAWLRAMRRGDVERAWEIADREVAHRRLSGPSLAARPSQRIWDGRPIDGRRVLVRCGPGLGDAIQFARFLPALAARAGSVLVWAPAELLPLLATCAAPVEYRPLDGDDPGIDGGGEDDVDLGIAELPWVLRCTIATLPARAPYLHAVPLSRASRGDRLTVGVSWSGDPGGAGGVAPALLAPIAAVPGIEAVALAVRPTAGDRAAWTGDWLPIATLTDLAGVIASLDLVIGPDAACVHLAGALGIPVWTLLDHEAHWRWMEDRDDSPWYPTMRLFRQPSPHRWDAVAAQVLAECRAAGRSRPRS
jgi:hypothetical protein